MILEGTTSSGAVVPVQVTTDGKVVAEGRTGPEGPQGPEGPEGPQGPEGPAGSPGNLWSGTDPGPIYYTGGSVGIGTSSPSAKTQITSGSSGVTPVVHADELFVENNGNAGITIGTPNTNTGRIVFGDPENNQAGGLFYSHSNNSLAIDVNGGTALTIDSSQRVGIGTSSPQRLLHVHESTSGTNSYIQLTNNDTGSATASGLEFIVASPGKEALIIQREDANLEFWTNNSVKAQIDSTGRLLVGRTSPPAGTLAGDVVCQGAVVLQSPNGMWWAIEVQNDGTLFASQTSVR